VVAGAADEIVQTGAFASKDDYGIRRKVELVVILRAALVEADAPEVVLLKDFERADHVDDAGDAEMLGSACRGFDGNRAEGGGAALGEQDAVDAGTFGAAEESAEVLGVFNAVEREDEAGLGTLKDVLKVEELAFADDGDDSLVGSGLSHAGESVAWLEPGFDPGFAAQVKELGEAMVRGLARAVALARYAHVVEAAGTGAESLFDGVQTVKVFHWL
jgi:hypothetical protein